MVSILSLGSNIAPLEGRKKLAGWMEKPFRQQKLTWKGSGFYLVGKLEQSQKKKLLSLNYRVNSRDPEISKQPWIELSINDRSIQDIFLVGTRPLPDSNISCICRYPFNESYLVAATRDSRLLLLDGQLKSNLKILAKSEIESPIKSLACFGTRLIGLDMKQGNSLYIYDCTGKHTSPFTPFRRFGIPFPLDALAENDSLSVWGINSAGKIYLLDLINKTSNKINLSIITSIQKSSGQILEPAEMNINNKHSIKYKWQKIIYHILKKHFYYGLAWDGQFFWSFRANNKDQFGKQLLLFDQKGRLISEFNCQSEISISSLSYTHKSLLVLDLKNSHLHEYFIADNLLPVYGGKGITHPGYLPAGTSLTGGIHNLCLLYVGGEGNKSVHRYCPEKIWPLLSYRSSDGTILDTFMDGFLLLAQYSPLLNGRTFGTDLPGPPSYQEDWIALFKEYFRPENNLYALEKCAREVSKVLRRYCQIKIVLGVPTPDPRCTNWDGAGLSLTEEENCLKVVKWALKELLRNWSQARFKYLKLTGFYYMTEQGSLENAVIKNFPGFCKEYGLRSYVIPGIYSSWLTEFSRAGFDCTALQSSHAFSQPKNRPPYYLLKCTGSIARNFGMGMEVELPYEVTETEGMQKVRDYLHMARIQGWAGVFKAYFQSFNLIKKLADSFDPECRKLYDELYDFSRISYKCENNLHFSYKENSIYKWQAELPIGAETFRLNIEEYGEKIELISLKLADL